MTVESDRPGQDLQTANKAEKQITWDTALLVLNSWMDFHQNYYYVVQFGRLLRGVGQGKYEVTPVVPGESGVVERLDLTFGSEADGNKVSFSMGSRSLVVEGLKGGKRRYSSGLNLLYGEATENPPRGTKCVLHTCDRSVLFLGVRPVDRLAKKGPKKIILLREVRGSDFTLEEGK